jgi:hypothetical protein
MSSLSLNKKMKVYLTLIPYLKTKFLSSVVSFNNNYVNCYTTYENPNYIKNKMEILQIFKNIHI